MKGFLTIDEVAQELNITRQTVSKYISEGEINAIRIGNRYRIPATEFAEYINSNSTIREVIPGYFNSIRSDQNTFSFLQDLRSSGDKLDSESINLNPYEINHSDEFNSYILGDNLDVLAFLLPEIERKVDLVYIDPPFGTGQVYSDIDKQHAYDDTLIHGEFLGFLRDRLILLRKCLSQRGSIYVHIDKKIGHYVKIIMDDVFGYKNFINEITRIKCNPKNFKRKAYGNTTDVILFYTLNRNKHIWNDIREPLPEDAIRRLFSNEHPTNGRYTTNPLHAPGETNDGDTGMEWKGMMPPKGRHWRYSRKELTKLDAKGLVEWSKTGNPRKIVFAKDHPGVKIQDIWEFKDKGLSYVDYPTQKNENMLGRIILNSSHENSLVLDCFAGSGMTLLAAQRHNRKWLGIDSSEHAMRVARDIMSERGIRCNYYVADCNKEEK